MPKRTSESNQSTTRSLPVIDGQRRFITINPAVLDQAWKEEWATRTDSIVRKHTLAIFAAHVGNRDDRESSPPISEPQQTFLLEMLVPMSITSDFLANLTEIYETRWLPTYGARRAKWLWDRQCIGLITRHWFDVAVTAVERLRKAIISWG